MIDPKTGYLVLDKRSDEKHVIVDIGLDGDFTFRLRDERGTIDDDYFLTTNIADLDEEILTIVRPPGR